MIERFKPGGARIFLAGGRFPYLDELAREESVQVIPFLDDVAGHPELLLSDGHHPTREGYTVVVRNVLKVLEPFLIGPSRRSQPPVSSVAAPSHSRN